MNNCNGDERVDMDVPGTARVRVDWRRVNH